MAPKRELGSPEPQPRQRAFGPERPPAVLTEEYVAPPVAVEKQICKCTTSCADGTSCACQAWGTACKSSCACHQQGAENCSNIFNHYFPLFFGPGKHVRVTPCFKKFLLAAHAGRKNGITIEEMEKMILRTIEDSPYFDEGIRKWLRAFQKMAPESFERPAHLQKLFRMALAGKGSQRWYSFCRRCWVEDNVWTHCWTCDHCQPEEQTWHCSRCNKCRDSRMERCEGCGGVSWSVELERDVRGIHSSADLKPDTTTDLPMR